MISGTIDAREAWKFTLNTDIFKEESLSIVFPDECDSLSDWEYLSCTQPCHVLERGEENFRQVIDIISICKTVLSIVQSQTIMIVNRTIVMYVTLPGTQHT